ncbi:MAG: 4Fe-4S ferredoxin [Chroococcidiopsidaceae cyanobacterium CP_BM_RX_35]|nr:4Fe-4S ferredoxin [Chroococcidiopsidaceae cyanobacterium CP_BM_RX_35]
MTDLYSPLSSLKKGRWFKLICGASFQSLPAVRNLTLAYTLAGADCIDVAADAAVILAAQEARQAATRLTDEARQRGGGGSGKTPPWLMVSFNDGEDPHFRKAEFNRADCPTDCPRPCEDICPAQAIVFPPPAVPALLPGVMADRCYGCGRCLPVCPSQLIYTRSYVSRPGAIAPLVLSTGIDAVEIHTQVGRLADFKRLWETIVPWVDQLRLVAISCPDGDDLIDYLGSIYNLISPLPCPLLWQTDGRPMSGDIGDGTTRAAVKLGQKVLAAGLPGYVQLAGGTNSYTVAKLRALGLLKEERGRGRGEEGGTEEDKAQPNALLEAPSPPLLPSLTKFRSEGASARTSRSFISGVAYGSYARALLSPILDQLEKMEVNQASRTPTMRLEAHPDLLWQAVTLAHTLVAQLKSPQVALSLGAEQSLAPLTFRHRS